MRRSLTVVGLLVLTLLLAACGGTSPAAQVSSSTMVVTNFNGQINVTSTKQASLVSSSHVLERASTVAYVSGTEVIAAQNEGTQSRLFGSFDDGRGWTQISVVPGTIELLDFVSSDIGFALTNDPNEPSSTSLLATVNGGQTWTSVNTGSFESVGFVSAHVGFAVMQGTTTQASGQKASIDETKDGGKTWTQVPSTLPAGVNSASFSFVNPTEGFLLAGVTNGVASQSKYFYHTVNSGATWSLLAMSPSIEYAGGLAGALPSSGFVGEMQFVDPLQGFAQLSQYGFVQTLDGGKTWNVFQLKGLPIESATRAIGFAAWGPQSFSVATSHTSFWVTTSPNHWNRVYPPYRETGLFGGQSGLDALSQTGQLAVVDTSSSQQQLAHIPAGTIQINPFSSGMMAYTASRIYATTDGTRWEQVPTPHGWSLLQGHFITPNFGIVVANNNGPPGSAVLELTRNGGNNWAEIKTRFRPYAIDPVTTTHWWALGGTEVTYTTNTSELGSKQMLWNLYYTGDGGKTWDEFIANWHAVGGLDFVSTTEGYVWVPGALYRTIDRGSSFVRYNLPSQISLEGINAMAFQPGGVGWALGNAGYPIYHTIDAGMDWGSNP